MKNLSRYNEYSAIDFVMDDYFKKWVQYLFPGSKPILAAMAY